MDILLTNDVEMLGLGECSSGHQPPQWPLRSFEMIPLQPHYFHLARSPLNHFGYQTEKKRIYFLAKKAEKTPKILYFFRKVWPIVIKFAKSLRKWATTKSFQLPDLRKTDEFCFSQNGRKTPKILYFFRKGWPIVIKFAKSLRKQATIVENNKKQPIWQKNAKDTILAVSHFAKSPLDHFDYQTKKKQ